jgi:hypothetical protein
MEPEKIPTERSSLPWLLGLAVVLAGLVLWDWRPDRDAQRAPQKGATTPIATARQKGNAATTRSLEPADSADQFVHALSNLALDQLQDTVRRPLFEKTRRATPQPRIPEEVASGEAIRGAVDPSALTLLGVLLSEGRAIALMNRKDTGQNVRVEEGDTVDGWTVERIELQRVVLRQGDAQIALQVFLRR